MDQTYNIPDLPLATDVEDKAVLREVAKAYRALSDLKSEIGRIPNPGILIDTLSLQEAQASSEIENIVTTQDELFRIGPGQIALINPNQKEVAKYQESLFCGFEGLRASDGLLTNNSIISMFTVLKNTTGGFRTTPGTALKNDATGEIVYVPPQHIDAIHRHMKNLELYINDNNLCDLDPLIKMAIIHHQFESIHPFPDGNGRIGRIINVLYLVQQGILDTPILYLSRYITKHKNDYYRLLQAVRDEGAWPEWITYILKGIISVANETEILIFGIRGLMADYKQVIRSNHKHIYSHEFLNTLFRHPYTKVEYVVDAVGVGRQAAARHLDLVAGEGLLVKTKIGKSNYYVNTALINLFLDRDK